MLTPLELIDHLAALTPRPGATAIATMACSRQTRRCVRLPSPSGVRWRPQQAHRARSVRHPGRRPPMPARRRATSGSCWWSGCSIRCRWSVPTAARACAASPSSPRPRPSTRSSPTFELDQRASWSPPSSSGDGAAPLVSRWRAAPQMRTAAPRETPACIAPKVRQPRPPLGVDGTFHSH